MINNKIHLIILYLLTGSSLMAASHTLEKGPIRLAIADDGDVTLTDTRNGAVWTTVHPKYEGGQPRGGVCAGGPMPKRDAPPPVEIESVTKKGDAIIIRAHAVIPLLIEWRIARDGEVTLFVDSPDRDRQVKRNNKHWGQMFRYPEPFWSKNADYIVLPEDEGLLHDARVVDLEADHVRFMPKRVHKSLSMPWWGQTEMERGLMTRVDTPYHTVFKLSVCETPVGERSIPSLYHYFRADDRFGYTRKVTFSLIDRGGYVAMAKRFRTWAKNQGLLVTMREKAKANPKVNRLLGAMDMYIFHNRGRNNRKATGPITADHIRKLKNLGYEKLLLEGYASTQAKPEDVYTKGAMKAGEKLGWLMGSYNLYSWIYVERGGKTDPEKLAMAKKLCIQTRPDRFDWSSSPWGAHGYYCPVILERVLGSVAKQKADYGFTAFFTDTTTAGGSIRTCFNPEHPMRKTEAADHLNRALDAITAHGLVVGSEKGFWWAVPHCHYFTGVMTLIAYQNNYVTSKNHSKQGGLFRIDKPGYEKYMKEYNFGYVHRVPLFELVFGDCVYATRRWNDHHSRDPALWRMNDLLCILYGIAPIVTFSDKDGPHIFDESYAPYHERYMRTVKDVCSWHEKVGFDEMVSHRFLTEDRSVQESVFAGGNAVVVNFGENPWKHPKLGTVPSMGFKTFQQ